MTRLRPSVLRWLRTASLWGAATATLVPAGVVAQTGCQFVDPTRSAQSASIPGQGQVWYLGGPTFRCADGVRIQADTAVVYVEQNLTLLTGNVRFRDPERILLSDQARYFTRVGRLQAEGHLILRDTVRGSVIENGELVYLRRTPQRAREQITVVTGVDHVRPTATLYMRPAVDTLPAIADSVPPVDSILPATDTLPALADSLPPATDSVPAAADSLPFLLRIPVDSAATEPEDTVQVPYQVEADNLFLQGDEYFLAFGEVYIVRDSIYARGDSVEYDQVAGRMLIHGSAHVESASYDLAGQDINIGMVGGEMRTVRAVRRAELIGEDLKLTAPVILLFLDEGAPERLVAVPVRADPETLEEPDSVDLVRPVAEAERFRLVADSLEVLAPGDVLQRIYATGKARGDSSARDSLNVESLPAVARTDWLEGDTVIAHFMPAPPPDPDLPADTTRDAYELDRLVALGNAKSLYRLLPSDSTFQPGTDAPAVHYVTGSTITITMVEGEVDLMEVDGPTQGWHLEPEGKSARGDSVPPDTSGVPPDTMRAPPDTMSAPGAGRGPVGPGNPGPPQRGGPFGEDAALPAAAFRDRGRERRSGR